MLEFLQQIDVSLFTWLNGTLANPVSDLLMPIVTSDDVLRAIYAVAMALILWKGDRRLRILVLFSGMTLLLSDQFAAGFLKPVIGRPRPCHTLTNVHLLVGCGGGYAMPSAHAANAFGQAFMWSLAVKRIRWQLYVFAGLVAVSRVFVGVHYPGDIVFGALVGGLVGWLVCTGFLQLEERTSLTGRDTYAIRDRAGTERPDED